jgi:NADH-quinone oxidoreductase subunit M
MLLAILMLYFTSDLRLLSDEQLVAAHVVSPSLEGVARSTALEAFRTADRPLHTFNILALAQIGQLPNSPFAAAQVWGMSLETLAFLLLLIGFVIKVPVVPVHTWLPDAHVEAPTGGSVVLAAVMLKLGGYGFLRFSLPVVPDASQALAGVVIALSLVAVVYIGLVALVQTDMKKLIAYSSIAHMGFVTLGLFLFNALGIEGAIVQMVSHGFISAAMFLCVGVLYDRVHSRAIADYGGVANTMPVFAAFFMLFAMANAGLPGTSGFVGEFMVIMAAIEVSFWYAFLASTTLIFGAAYTLWMYRRVVFGEVANAAVAGLKDLSAREALVLGLLAVAVLGMGLWPLPFTEVLHTSVNDLVAHVGQSKLPAR